MNAEFSEKAWRDYLRLVEERPELFRQSRQLEIVLDEDAVREFVRREGRAIGVAYRSPYSIMVVDLVRGPDGRPFAYERLLPAATGVAVVTVPVFEGRYALLRQFRHALRREQYAFPRGFGEDGLSAVQNAAKELEEELGVRVLTSRTLGRITGDSGMQGGAAEVVRCEIGSVALKKDYEGILGLQLLAGEELNRWIAAGRLDDGYTLAAWALLRAVEPEDGLAR